LAVLKVSVALMRAAWLFLEWISRMGGRPGSWEKTSAVKETWRAVGKKTMHFEID
jgi:hypothetical protein